MTDKPQFDPDAIEDPEWQALWTRYKVVTEANNRREKEIAEKYGIVLDTDDMQAFRLRALIDAVLPVDSCDRLNFELKWQAQVAASLENAAATGAEQHRELTKRGLSLPPSVTAPRGVDSLVLP